MNVNYSIFPRLYRYVHEAERKTMQALLPTFLVENMGKKKKLEGSICEFLPDSAASVV